jgi:hypothetical protein
LQNAFLAQNQIVDNKSALRKLGFRLGPSGVHIGRTIMLEELRTLFLCVADPGSSKEHYAKAIIANNCLKKRSQKNRELSCRHLMTLYSLDPSVATFRALRYFWARNTKAQPLLALLSAYSRDGLLRMSAPFILSLKEGEALDMIAFKEFLNKKASGRLSEFCLGGLIRNVCGTLIRTGHLERKGKVRSKVLPTEGSVAYALFLGYLLGGRGKALFSTEFMHLLDAPVEDCIELAENASCRGWISFKRLEDVMEAQFPNLLSNEPGSGPSIGIANL